MNVFLKRVHNFCRKTCSGR